MQIDEDCDDRQEAEQDNRTTGELSYQKEASDQSAVSGNEW